MKAFRIVVLIGMTAWPGCWQVEDGVDDAKDGGNSSASDGDADGDIGTKTGRDAATDTDGNGGHGL
jgi:hypothetical protein